MLTIAYIQIMTLHTQGRFNNRTAHSLYMIIVMATSVMGVMKMGKIVPSVGIKQISQAFWVSVLIITPPRLPDITAIHTYLHIWFLA